MKVRALTTVRDIKTNALRKQGDEWDLDRPRDVLETLMRDGVIEIIEPAAKPAIQVELKDKGDSNGSNG